MKILEALNRMNWRMTNQKFTPNEKDKLAMQEIENWIINQKKEAYEKNSLFIKVFCYALYNEIAYIKDLYAGQRHLIEQLEKPIDYHYNRIHDLLNTIELERYKQKIGYTNKYNLHRTPEQDKANEELIKNNIEQFKKLHSMDEITIDEVYIGLNNLLTEVINKFK
jgi:hypothetical protein